MLLAPKVESVVLSLLNNHIRFFCNSSARSPNKSVVCIKSTNEPGQEAVRPPLDMSILVWFAFKSITSRVYYVNCKDLPLVKQGLLELSTPECLIP